MEFHRTAPFPRPALRRGFSCLCICKVVMKTYFAYLDKTGYIGPYHSRRSGISGSNVLIQMIDRVQTRQI